MKNYILLLLFPLLLFAFTTETMYSDQDMVNITDQIMFVAEARFGNNANNGDHELNIHNETETDSYNVLDVDQNTWTSGVAEPFTMTYDGSTVTFTIAGKTLTGSVPNAGYTDVFIRLRASKTNSSLVLSNVTYNGSSVGGDITASADGNGLVIRHLIDVGGSMTMTGNATFTFDSGSGSDPAFQIKFARVLHDFGDAPDTYKTTKSSGGAWHAINDKINFNGTPDAETTGSPSANSDGDDNNDTDDENAIASVDDSQAAEVTFNLNVNNTSGKTAYVYGWMDLNKNGSFESSEKVSTSTSTSGPVALTFSAMSFNGTYNLRFRVSHYNSLTASGYGGAGEVEDHIFAFSGALDVKISSLNAEQQDNQVKIYWVASAEMSTAGFNVLRSIDGKNYERLNDHMIAAVPSMINSYYEFFDQPNTPGSYSYVLEAINRDGSSERTEAVDINISATTGVKDNDMMPTEFSLGDNYPNPFNPSTTIKVAVPYAGQVTVDIYNSYGQLVETLHSGYLSQGVYEFTWNGQNLASGTYFYRMQADNFSAVKFMSLVK